jgi:hypothetical protein
MVYSNVQQQEEILLFWNSSGMAVGFSSDESYTISSGNRHYC